jgi:hypothetical protein
MNMFGGRRSNELGVVAVLVGLLWLGCNSSESVTSKPDAAQSGGSVGGKGGGSVSDGPVGTGGKVGGGGSAGATSSGGSGGVAGAIGTGGGSAGGADGGGSGAGGIDGGAAGADGRSTGDGNADVSGGKDAGGTDSRDSNGNVDAGGAGGTDGRDASGNRDAGGTGGTDGRDASGGDDSSSAVEVGSQCSTAGTYVSSSTCTTTIQCGTIERPWCTIQMGIDSGAGPQVFVARATNPYAEGIVLRNGVSVLGGYEPTFTAARNPDPASNGTLVQAWSSVFTWPDQVSATVDGFSVIAAQPTTSAEQRASFAVAGTAKAVIANVSLAPSTASSKYSTEYGILVGTGEGGSLDIQSSSFQPPDAGASIALATAAQANVSIAVTNSSLQAGKGSSISTGVELAGTGSFVMHGGSVKAGLAITNVGLHASATTSSAPRSVELHDVKVEGNHGAFAWGVQIVGAASLLMDGGSVLGKGPAEGDTATATGIAADSVATTTLTGVTVLASDAVLQHPTLNAHAVILSNTQNLTGAAATIKSCTLQGGSTARIRRGIVSQGVPLVLESSDVSGSLAAVELGGVTGPYSLTGVELTGTFPTGAKVQIRSNTRIVGGDALQPCLEYRCGGGGVVFNARVDSVIEKNQLVQGSYATSGFDADGVRINQGGTHLIQDNATIAGGGQADANEMFTGVRVVSAGDTVANVTLKNNTLVVGVPSASLASSDAIGFYGEGVNATIANNTRILGGWGYNSIGVWIVHSHNADRTLSTVQNQVTITGNTIDGGTRSGYGVNLASQTATVTGNLIRACGIETDAGQPDPNCKTTATSVGLQVTGDTNSLIANNYIFGGYTSEATACKVGCFQKNCLPQLSTSFVNNLCAVASTAYSYTTVSATALDLGMPPSGDCPLIANNILDASGTAGTVFVLSHLDPMGNSQPTECYKLLNNDLVPNGLACEAEVLLPPKACFASATTLNAAGNTVQQISGNRDVAPGYATPNLANPSAAGYHLSSACALGGLGAPVTAPTVDYDNHPRSGTAPTIGPDECP